MNTTANRKTCVHLAVMCIFIFSLFNAGGAAEIPAEKLSFENINKAFGAQLFADNLLWDDNDAAAAKRMVLAQESRTSTQASYRKYPSDTDRILGIRPYSIAMYSRSASPDYVSIIFINKGDYPPYLQAREMNFNNPFERDKYWNRLESNFGKDLAAEGEIIHKNMAQLLGVSKRTQFGQGSNMRDSVYRWDWNNHAFLLAITKDEYISLRIMSVEMADARGKGLGRVSDTELRNSLKCRVKRRSNGDVIITDIPMVNQGPKGYCVPATWERYLRYMDIPADMYSLAMAGKTEKGGGTSITAIVEGVMRLVSAHGRRIKTVRSDMRVQNISYHIDDGLPVMWAMLIVPELNDELTRRAAMRRNAADMNSWNIMLEPMRKAARKISPSKDNGHVCMIIGYNPTTEEIAISDSWGPAYEERWITVEEAKAISQGDLLVISW